MRFRGYLVLFTLALIWGASFLFIKIGVEEGLPPATLVVLRLSFSVATLVAIAIARPRLIRGWWRYWWLALLVGLVNVVVPYSLITWGETQIASGTTSILNATTPLFTVLLAAAWIGSAHERLSWRRVGGVLVGFVGVGVLIGPAALDFSNQSMGAVAGMLAVLIASAAYSVGALLSRRYGGAALLVGPLTTQVAALLLEIPLAIYWQPPTALPTPRALAAIAALGIFGTGIAYLLYFWLIRNVGATRTTIVTYLLPCTALLWGALFLGEAVTWNALAGLALVLLGTVTTNGTLGRRRRQGQPRGRKQQGETPASEVAPAQMSSSPTTSAAPAAAAVERAPADSAPSAAR
jgi:drug/metabolite transporter (DMT)-like permease